MSEKEDLETLRKAIRAIDTDLADLFERRMALVKEVALVKLSENRPIYDAQREEKNIEELSALIKAAANKPYFIKWYKMLMDVSKESEKDVSL